jgi:hypothetical protein
VRRCYIVVAKRLVHSRVGNDGRFWILTSIVYFDWNWRGGEGRLRSRIMMLEQAFETSRVEEIEVVHGCVCGTQRSCNIDVS